MWCFWTMCIHYRRFIRMRQFKRTLCNLLKGSDLQYSATLAANVSQRMMLVFSNILQLEPTLLHVQVQKLIVVTKLITLRSFIECDTQLERKLWVVAQYLELQSGCFNMLSKIDSLQSSSVLITIEFILRYFSLEHSAHLRHGTCLVGDIAPVKEVNKLYNRNYTMKLSH